RAGPPPEVDRIALVHLDRLRGGAAWAVAAPGDPPHDRRLARCLLSAGRAADGPDRLRVRRVAVRLRRHLAATTADRTPDRGGRDRRGPAARASPTTRGEARRVSAVTARRAAAASARARDDRR